MYERNDDRACGTVVTVAFLQVSREKRMEFLTVA